MIYIDTFSLFNEKVATSVLLNPIDQPASGALQSHGCMTQAQSWKKGNFDMRQAGRHLWMLFSLFCSNDPFVRGDVIRINIIMDSMDHLAGYTKNRNHVIEL